MNTFLFFYIAKQIICWFCLVNTLNYDYILIPNVCLITLGRFKMVIWADNNGSDSHLVILVFCWESNSRELERNIEDKYTFIVNTKYISSSVLKTSEVSWLRSTSEYFDDFNSRNDMYLVFTITKSKFSLKLHNL